MSTEILTENEKKGELKRLLGGIRKEERLKPRSD